MFLLLFIFTEIRFFSLTAWGDISECLLYLQQVDSDVTEGPSMTKSFFRFKNVKGFEADISLPKQVT